MKQLVTSAIVLSRTDYGEADRIITVLTPAYGKLSLLAKGVRRVKSKLAGGIELFSVSEITFIKGRGAVGTLASSRLNKHYNHIVSNLERTMLGYELLKQLNKNTEDEPEAAYFDLLEQVFEALDDLAVPVELIRFWFAAQLLRLGGRMPNLTTDTAGERLTPNLLYRFDYDHMTFEALPVNAQASGFAADHIKFLRLVFAGNPPKILQQVQGSTALQQMCEPLVLSLTRRV